MFAALSDGWGNVGDKLNNFIALAPIVNLKMATNPLVS
jgi:hypothetical protein